MIAILDLEHEHLNSKFELQPGPFFHRRRSVSAQHGRQAGWKGQQGHWAQQRAAVQRTDSPHTGQAGARLSIAALPGVGAGSHDR